MQSHRNILLLDPDRKSRNDQVFKMSLHKERDMHSQEKENYLKHTRDGTNHKPRNAVLIQNYSCSPNRPNSNNHHHNNNNNKQRHKSKSKGLAHNHAQQNIKTNKALIVQRSLEKCKEVQRTFPLKACEDLVLYCKNLMFTSGKILKQIQEGIVLKESDTNVKILANQKYSIGEYVQNMEKQIQRIKAMPIDAGSMTGINQFLFNTNLTKENSELRLELDRLQKARLDNEAGSSSKVKPKGDQNTSSRSSKLIEQLLREETQVLRRFIKDRLEDNLQSQFAKLVDLVDKQCKLKLILHYNQKQMSREKEAELNSLIRFVRNQYSEKVLNKRVRCSAKNSSPEQRAINIKMHEILRYLKADANGSPASCPTKLAPGTISLNNLYLAEMIELKLYSLNLDLVPVYKKQNEAYTKQIKLLKQEIQYMSALEQQSNSNKGKICKTNSHNHLDTVREPRANTEFVSKKNFEKQVTDLEGAMDKITSNLQRVCRENNLVDESELKDMNQQAMIDEISKSLRQALTNRVNLQDQALKNQQIMSHQLRQIQRLSSKIDGLEEEFELVITQKISIKAELEQYREHVESRLHKLSLQLQETELKLKAYESARQNMVSVHTQTVAIAKSEMHSQTVCQAVAVTTQTVTGPDYEAMFNKGLQEIQNLKQNYQQRIEQVNATNSHDREQLFAELEDLQAEDLAEKAILLAEITLLKQQFTSTQDRMFVLSVSQQALMKQNVCCLRDLDQQKSQTAMLKADNDLKSEEILRLKHNLVSYNIVQQELRSAQQELRNKASLIQTLDAELTDQLRLKGEIQQLKQTNSQLKTEVNVLVQRQADRSNDTSLFSLAQTLLQKQLPGIASAAYWNVFSFLNVYNTRLQTVCQRLYDCQRRVLKLKQQSHSKNVQTQELSSQTETVIGYASSVQIQVTYERNEVQVQTVAQSTETDQTDTQTLQTTVACSEVQTEICQTMCTFTQTQQTETQKNTDVSIAPSEPVKQIMDSSSQTTFVTYNALDRLYPQIDDLRQETRVLRQEAGSLAAEFKQQFCQLVQRFTALEKDYECRKLVTASPYYLLLEKLMDQLLFSRVNLNLQQQFKQLQPSEKEKISEYRKSIGNLQSELSERMSLLQKITELNQNIDKLKAEARTKDNKIGYFENELVERQRELEDINNKARGAQNNILEQSLINQSLFSMDEEASCVDKSLQELLDQSAIGGDELHMTKHELNRTIRELQRYKNIKKKDDAKLKSIREVLSLAQKCQTQYQVNQLMEKLAKIFYD